VQGRRNMRAPLLAGNGPLARVRPILVFVVVIALFATGVLVSGVVGAIVLGVLAAAVAVLLATTWRALSSSDRVMRVVVLGILVAVAIMQLR
jgi:chromate transport protein ChrA